MLWSPIQHPFSSPVRFDTVALKIFIHKQANCCLYSFFFGKLSVCQAPFFWTHFFFLWGTHFDLDLSVAHSFRTRPLSENHLYISGFEVARVETGNPIEWETLPGSVKCSFVEGMFVEITTFLPNRTWKLILKSRGETSEQSQNKPVVLTSTNPYPWPSFQKAGGCD